MLLAGRNAVCTDAVCTAVMGYDPQAGHMQFPFPGENHLRLLASVGVGSIDLKRIEVRGMPPGLKRVIPRAPPGLKRDFQAFYGAEAAKRRIIYAWRQKSGVSNDTGLYSCVHLRHGRSYSQR